MKQTIKRFLLIDDDPMSNFISARILENSFGTVHIDHFTVPGEGLEFIKNKLDNIPTDEKTALFLDIGMQLMSGWEFLEAFDLFDPSIKDRYNIYILSSSVRINDINIAKANPLVIDFIEKPLNGGKVLKIFC